MFSKIKKIFIKTCPRSLLNAAVVIVHKGRMVRSKATMILRPQKAVWFCPCCGYRFQTFIAGDYSEWQARFNASRYEHTRQDVLCPVCKALSRHRILASWTEKYIELFKKPDILVLREISGTELNES